MSLQKHFIPQFLVAIALLIALMGCSLPQVSAEERLFLELSLDFLGAYELPLTTVADTPVRGLSAITYDRQRDRFYALSDDRSNEAPARFYTLKLILNSTAPERIGIETIEVEKVTLLTAETGELYPAGTIDPEGIALSPRQSVFISSEGVASEAIAPFVNEFDLETGALKGQLPIPERYLPKTADGQPQGVQDNLGFEALTLNPGGYSAAWLEPFRLFTATEAALQQDRDVSDSAPNETQPIRSRFLHYLVGDQQTTLISEHLYLTEPPPIGEVLPGSPYGNTNGLVELLVLDQGGHFLSLERSFSIRGFNAKIFQLATGGATDTSVISTFSGDIGGIQPIHKHLLLDLSDLEISLDNLEGMTLGPQLPDGTQSLLLVSDDNFNDLQVTQFLLFRLRGEQFSRPRSAFIPAS